MDVKLKGAIFIMQVSLLFDEIEHDFPQGWKHLRDALGKLLELATMAIRCCYGDACRQVQASTRI